MKHIYTFLFILVTFMCSAQVNVDSNGNFYKQKSKKATTYYPTGKTYTNTKGDVYPVYKNSNGILYIPHKNKTTGKIYWTKLIK